MARTADTAMGFVSMQMDQPKLKLRVGVSSVGRLPIPDRRVRQAVHDTFTAGVKLPYSVGRLHVTERVRLPPVIQGPTNIRLRSYASTPRSKWPVALDPVALDTAVRILSNAPSIAGPVTAHAWTGRFRGRNR